MEKPKDFKGSVKKLLSALKPWRVQLGMAALLSILSASITIFGPKVLGNATTEIFTGVMRKVQGTGGIDFAAIGQVLLLLIGLYLISSPVLPFHARLGADAANALGRKMRQDIGESSTGCPWPIMRKTPWGTSSPG